MGGGGGVMGREGSKRGMEAREQEKQFTSFIFLKSHCRGKQTNTKYDFFSANLGRRLLNCTHPPSTNAWRLNRKSLAANKVSL